jgi:hypothetical protein
VVIDDNRNIASQHKTTRGDGYTRAFILIESEVGPRGAESAMRFGCIAIAPFERDAFRRNHYRASRSLFEHDLSRKHVPHLLGSTENRYPPRIKCGADFLRIML